MKRQCDENDLTSNEDYLDSFKNLERLMMIQSRSQINLANLYKKKNPNTTKEKLMEIFSLNEEQYICTMIKYDNDNDKVCF